MICSGKDCNTKLKCVHSYTSSSGADTKRLVCPSCGLVHTAVSFVVVSDPGRGQGASTLAKKLSAPEKLSGALEHIRKAAEG